MKYYHYEIESFHSAVLNYFPHIEQKLANLRKCLENVSSRTGAIEGETAVAIDAFIDEVHFPILDEFDQLVASYKELLASAMCDFHDSVDSEPGQIDNDYLGELATRLTTSNTNFSDLDTRVVAKCNEYSDVIGSKPAFTPLQIAFDDSKGAVTKAREDFENFDANHKADLDDIIVQLNSIKALCTQHNASKIDSGRYTYDITKYQEEVDPDVVAALLEEFCIYDDEGNVIGYNWDAIEEVMSKPGTLITQSEYYALSVIYLQMGDEDMEHFLGLCTTPSSTSGSTTYYKPDQYKLDMISAHVESIVETELMAQVVLDNMTDEELAENGLDSEKRTVLLNTLYGKYQNHLQHLTALGVVSGFGEMEGDAQGPHLHLNSDGDALRLQYGCGNTQYSYTIQVPETGESLREHGYGQIASYFGLDGSSDFAVDESRKTAIDIAITMATEGVEGFFVDYGPIGIGVVKDIMDEYQKRNDGQNLLNLMDTLEYGSALELFGCVVTREVVTITTSPDGYIWPITQSSNMVYFYPSRFTQNKIDWLNNHLANNGVEIAGYNGVTNLITMEDVINDPEGVQEILDYLTSADEANMRDA